jgi:hypothetical protein
MVADVPCAGLQVQLVLQMRKFFCDTPQCPRKIFTERVPVFVEPWARMTTRFSQMLQALGLATCGELGARLAAHLGMHTSATTLLRRVMAKPSAPAGPVSSLGIDDWSFRPGRTFGTILVDLDRHVVIDLLGFPENGNGRGLDASSSRNQDRQSRSRGRLRCRSAQIGSSSHTNSR